MEQAKRPLPVTVPKQRMLLRPACSWDLVPHGGPRRCEASRPRPALQPRAGCWEVRQGKRRLSSLKVHCSAALSRIELALVLVLLGTSDLPRCSMQFNQHGD